MDVNLFWYAQEALTSPEVYLAPDTPLRGTRHAYKLTQQRNQRITERAIRCHAYELQQAHSSIAQHIDRQALHSPKETNPLLEFTCGDKFLRDNQHKFDKLLDDIETMMSLEYEPMDMSDDDSQAVKCKDDDYMYRGRFRKEAEDAYNKCIQWHIDSQQTRWEDLRRYMTDEAASIMNEIVEHQKALAPPTAPAIHNEPIQHNPKRKRKREKHIKSDDTQQQHSTPSLPPSSASSSSIPPPVTSSSSVKKSHPQQNRPSASSSNIPPAVTSSTSSSRVPKVVPASTSRSTGRSNQVPSVASSSSSSSSNPRVPEVASAPSWNASSYRPSLVHNGKISIKKIAGKGYQVVCEKKNEPIKILGTPQEFDEALYHPGSKSNIKLQFFQGTKVFRSVDNRGRLQTIAQVDEIEPLIRQYFLTSSQGHERML